MTEQNRPRHSREPEQGPYDNSGYDDSYDEAYAYPAAATGAGAAGAAGVAGTSGEPPEKSGPPLRGMAMILTAVAVVLIIWGAFSLFGGDDDSDDTLSGSDTSATAAAPAPGEADQGASEAAGADGSDDADGADGADGASNDPASSAQAPVPGDEAGTGDSAAEVDRGIGVTVLNNSTESGLSQSGADRVRDSDWTNVGYGNLQGRIEGISEESRVYYPEGNAAAQAAAEQVATDLGLQAAPGNADYYNRFREASVREGGAADAVVVVLTGPLG